MKAVNLSFYKRELTSISKELFLEHGWPMPSGLRDHRQRDPLRFTLEEWQQAKRSGLGAKQTKALIRECWNSSDSRQSFEAALREKGYWLAQGDRRGFVAVDWRGEIYSLSRTTGAKTKELKARIGDPKALLSVDETRAQIGEMMSSKLKAWAKEEEAKAHRTNLAAQFQREQMVQRHRKARADLKSALDARWLLEEKARAANTPRGIRGLWGWITGKSQKTRRINEAEIAQAARRDRAEKQKIIQQQLAERRNLQRQIRFAREKQQARIQELGRDVARAIELGRVPEKQASTKNRSRTRDTGRDRDRDNDFSPT